MIAPATIAASATPMHAKQWTGPGVLVLDEDKGLRALPGDYVLTFGAGHREVMDEPRYHAKYGKPERSAYWETKFTDEIAHAVGAGV